MIDNVLGILSGLGYLKGVINQVKVIVSPPKGTPLYL